MERKITKVMKVVFFNMLIVLFSFSACKKDSVIEEQNDDNLPDIIDYQIVGTNQTTFYGDSAEITAPVSGEAFYGQNANYPGTTPSYTDNGDGTVTDNITGLMWSQSPDMNNDGTIDSEDKLTYDEAVAGASSFTLKGYSDWRLPTIKELYSLIMFTGIDPILEAQNDDGVVPFINTNYFDFGYGDVDAGERIIDAQFVSSTQYVSTTMNGDETVFGVNFADGRIKGYPISGPMGSEFYVYYVRGNMSYGVNNFIDNGDGTITDQASGLMWTQNDNGEGLNWEEALEYAESFEYAGYNDWRLPDIKELQSIVDYTRSPATSSSAAIDPILNSTGITNEDDEADYPYYWSNTTHYSIARLAENAAYIAFGRGLGNMDDNIMDVHGAGCQRTDPKVAPEGGGTGGGAPQGDIARSSNYVRLVRKISE